MRPITLLTLLVCIAIAPLSHSAIETYAFETPQQEALYNKMIQELRCLVCQNQNLADSNAQLAQDLRKETYRLVAEGSQEQAVVEFMVSRYGDFVLYRPPFKASTLALWLGPVVLLLIGFTILIVHLRNKQREPANHADSDTLQQQARTLLKQEQD